MIEIVRHSSDDQNAERSYDTVIRQNQAEQGPINYPHEASPDIVEQRDMESSKVTEVIDFETPPEIDEAELQKILMCADHKKSLSLDRLMYMGYNQVPPLLYSEEEQYYNEEEAQLIREMEEMPDMREPPIQEMLIHDNSMEDTQQNKSYLYEQNNDTHDGEEMNIQQHNPFDILNSSDQAKEKIVHLSTINTDENFATTKENIDEEEYKAGTNQTVKVNTETHNHEKEVFDMEMLDKKPKSKGHNQLLSGADSLLREIIQSSPRETQDMNDRNDLDHVMNFNAGELKKVASGGLAEKEKPVEEFKEHMQNARTSSSKKEGETSSLSIKYVDDIKVYSPSSSNSSIKVDQMDN